MSRCIWNKQMVATYKNKHNTSTPVPMAPQSVEFFIIIIITSSDYAIALLPS